MPVITDMAFNEKMLKMVTKTYVELGSLVEELLVKQAMEQKNPRPLRPSEINQNILLALIQFERDLTEAVVQGLAFATSGMEAKMKEAVSKDLN